MAESDEKSLILDKTMVCDACQRKFTTKQVKTGKARLIGTDDILKPLYSGIDVVKYDIILCPHCGYAASQRNFGHLTSKQRESIRSNIEPKFTMTLSDDEVYSYDVAIRRCKMAMLTEMVTHGKISESAYLCLKLAWLYRGKIDELMEMQAPDEYIAMYRRYEQEYIADAYKGFKEAIQTMYPPICGMDEMTINYLLASLGFKCGELEESRKFAGTIITSRSASSKLKEKARDIIEQIKKCN
ncbi:MAG: DUF2225 domain-containing protein [Lachnospira sp.]